MATRSGAYLLIDDDFDDQEIFRIALLAADPWGECIFANDGEYALRLLKNEPIHPLIIFIDFNMISIVNCQWIHGISRSTTNQFMK